MVFVFLVTLQCTGLDRCIGTVMNLDLYLSDAICWLKVDVSDQPHTFCMGEMGARQHSPLGTFFVVYYCTSLSRGAYLWFQIY